MPTLILTVAITQLIILALALRYGRAIARLLLVIFIPPKSRQLFSFLWHCDGKAMTPISARREGEALAEPRA